MNVYKCHAMIEASIECGRICWGKTIYCMWHNCWLTWYKLYLYFFPQRRSIAWAAYDRDFLRDMRLSPIISTRLSLQCCFNVVLFTIVFYLTHITKYYQSRAFLEIFSDAVWAVAFICILTMALGNKNIVFPKLLLGVSFILVSVHIFRMIFISHSFFITENIITLCGRLSLLLWALPIPTGPLWNTMADVSNIEQFPPGNIGAVMLRSLGAIFYIIYQIGKQYI